MKLLQLKKVRRVLNEPTTYTYCGEKTHAIFGRYVIGNDYLCIKDHSLLDTQILLIDEKGGVHWEDAHNFQCTLTPIKFKITIRYYLDLCGDIKDYSYYLVWYKERSYDELKEEVIKDLQKRVHHEVEVIGIEEV